MFLPAGSRDLTGKQLTNRVAIYETFQSVVNLRNYQSIETPVIEYSNTFTNSYAGMTMKKMLKWFDEEGEIEVLRPDWTIAVARALSNQQSKQQKWAYAGSVFRKDHNGVESHQAGIEIIRTPGLYGEYESLFTAVRFLRELGVDSYSVELGHTEIFETFIASLELDEEKASQVRQAMHDKRKDEVYRLISETGSEQTAAAVADLADAFGGTAVLAKYEQEWAEEPKLLAVIQELQQLALALEELGQDVIVDLGRVKQLPYYNGAMFRGFVAANGAECFSGGRYDELYEQFGGSMSAVGLAFDMDVLAAALPAAAKQERVCLMTDEQGLIAAEKLRDKFPHAVVDVRVGETAESYDQVFQLVRNGEEYEVKVK
ncbi:ATP phosphoribosyltransferase regulatory subunit [Terribacillus sp. DMT04]|uniref:ATP phosphoribosyltransferase regulatory subunit n=1 Tax=Terribacillus sp. DMT04 TaxID=2850441 RepID=UPI001C2C4630|nr:ATP phosphoribosyltransferase regulatory subunit [Terribacillus sp. DMT04]QXE03232.1 ATP phosphoribosyltransferase regulatory subunit [Terribacillus sp. DMT04]